MFLQLICMLLKLPGTELPRDAPALLKTIIWLSDVLFYISKYLHHFWPFGVSSHLSRSVFPVQRQEANALHFSPYRSPPSFPTFPNSCSHWLTGSWGISLVDLILSFSIGQTNTQHIQTALLTCFLPMQTSLSSTGAAAGAESQEATQRH